METGDHTLQLVHTGNLDAPTRQAARALLYEVFDDMEESDWEHCLGGMHAVVWEADELVGHASLIMRRLIHGGRALRTGYIEAVAVRADRQKLGYGAVMMDALERILRGAYEVGALGASDDGAGFYAARGWRPWRGRSWALTPAGVVRTAEEDDGIYVLEVSVPLDLDGDLTCDWREGALW